MVGFGRRFGIGWRGGLLEYLGSCRIVIGLLVFRIGVFASRGGSWERRTRYHEHNIGRGEDCIPLGLGITALYITNRGQGKSHNR